jgi:two-component system KDP operon response regulator KdpE
MSETAPRIVVIDDEQAIRRLLRTILEAHGYQVFEADSGEAGLATVAQQHPDVVILDLGLPGMDGVEATRRLREWSEIPILILSVREQEADKVAALDAGADDYLTKPFGAAELLARLRAARRRASHSLEESTFTLDDLTVDMLRRVVTVKGEEVQLTPTEYDLLRTLVNYAGRVVTHQQLLRQVWGQAYENQFHLLRVNVSNLRHKIEPEPARPRYIITEPGVGYRLRDEA